MSEPSLPAANLWPGNPAEMTFNDPPTFLQMALYNYDVIGPLQLCNSPTKRTVDMLFVEGEKEAWTH